MAEAVDVCDRLRLKFPDEIDKIPCYLQEIHGKWGAWFCLHFDGLEELKGALLFRAGCRDDIKGGRLWGSAGDATDVAYDAAEELMLATLGK